MTGPLSEEYLAEVEAAIPLGYDGPWDFVPAEEGGSWLVGYSTDNPDAGLVATVPDYGFYLADFIARARTDVPALLAEVARQRRVILRLTGGADAGVQRVRVHNSEAGAWRVRWKQDGRPKAKTLPTEAEAQEWAKRLKGGAL